MHHGLSDALHRLYKLYRWIKGKARFDERQLNSIKKLLTNTTFGLMILGMLHNCLYYIPGKQLNRREILVKSKTAVVNITIAVCVFLVNNTKFLCNELTPSFFDGVSFFYL